MVNTIKELADEINKVYDGTDVLITIENIVKSYNGNDWKDHVTSGDKPYIKNSVYENENYEIFVVSWMPHRHSTIHDHAENGCIFKVLKGTLTEEKYHPKTINYLGKNIYETNGVSYIINQTSLHRVINYCDDIAVSLHIYSPPRYKIKSYEPSTR